MAIGKRKSVQQPLLVSTVDLALARPHPYYSALNRVLDAHQFDSFVEQLCGKFHAGNMGRPGVTASNVAKRQYSDAQAGNRKTILTSQFTSMSVAAAARGQWYRKSTQGFIPGLLVVSQGSLHEWQQRLKQGLHRQQA